jgi:homoserine dehydrogenase
VRGVFNAVYVDADYLGPTLYYGRGAGRRATASAVAGDLIEIARNILNGVSGRVPPLAFQPEAVTPAKIKPMGDVRCRYYVRLLAVDKPGVLSKIAGVLGDNNISIESVVQKGRDAGQSVPLILMTHEAREADVMSSMDEIRRIGVINDAPVVVRVER